MRFPILRTTIIAAISILVVAPAIFAQTSPQTAAPKIVQLGTPTATSDQATLLMAARSRYYNLRVAGVKSFHCNVEIDWPAFFASLGQKLPDDTPLLATLRATRVSVTDEILAGPKAEWAYDKPPATPDPNVVQMMGGLKQMVEGFFTAWNPTLNGKLITMAPNSFKPTGAGYLLDDSTPDTKDLITFDKDLSVTHLSTNSTELGFEADTTFKPSDHGLIMTRLEGDYRQPSSAPAVHVSMTTQFGPVDKYFLPIELEAGVPNVAIFKMHFTGCTVQPAETE